MMTLKSRAIKFIVLLGIVSLFADVTYEGARSITGPFFSFLGASGATVGIVVGLGELAGYGLRFFSGYLSDKTKQYWLITFIGYVINLLAIPLLAFANQWQTAAFLVILERFGKGLRVPARDTMLSFATKQTGRGWGFGLHEALDQIGAVIGPLAMAVILGFKESYHFGFACLAIPAFLALLSLGIAKRAFPQPQGLESPNRSLKTKGFHQVFWIYLIGVGLVAAGFANFALISYHFQQANLVSSARIPFLYALAMAVQGISAFFMGRIFDVKGIAFLALATGISALFAPLVFLGSFSVLLVGMILWGIGMGSQESIMRAIVADMVPPQKRGSAYGILNLVYGASWALGSAIIGFLYDVSLVYLVVFSMITQLAAIPFFLFVRK